LKTISGWIFEVYADAEGLSVWIIDTAGSKHHCHDTFSPSFFVYGSQADLHAVCVMLTAARLPVRLHRAERHDLFLRRDLVVLEVQVTRPLLFASIFKRVQTFKPDLTFYNADLTPAQFYYFEKNLFPLAYCEVQVDTAGHILEIELKDSRWSLDYPLPPLKIMSLQLTGEAQDPNHGFRSEIEVQIEERVSVLDASDPREMLLSLSSLLRQHDPDLLISRYGDSFILPKLLELSERYRIPIPLNRDPKQRSLSKRAYSYSSYGRIVYRSASQVLFGRWHIDLQNSFRMGDYWLDGIFELSRLTGLSVQKTARTSTGTGISAMEAATAYHRQILIPFQKREPEDFKSAAELIVSDKGGLTYRPLVGLHEEVAEIDFASMYPFIMAKFNISPETVDCPCCQNQVVPEIGYSICAKHKGLIPETLEPLVAKRLRYKLGAKDLTDDVRRKIYRERAQALKGILVTCFGYTGYKNDSYIKLLFLRSRYYSPDTARFLSKDSWQGDYTRPQSLDAWAYTEGNPINRTDPSGLIAEGQDAIDAQNYREELQSTYGIEIWQDWGYGRLTGWWYPGAWRSADELKSVLGAAYLSSAAMGGPAKFKSAMNGTLWIVRQTSPNPSYSPPYFQWLLGDVVLNDFMFNTYNVDFETYWISHEFGHAWDFKQGQRLSRGMTSALGTSVCTQVAINGVGLGDAQFLIPSVCVCQFDVDAKEPPPGDPKDPYAGTSAWEDWAEAFANYVDPTYYQGMRNASNQTFNLLGPLRRQYVEEQIRAIP
jgi:RHS repeat-associated protein